MNQFFLTSSGDKVLADIAKKLPKNPKEYNVAFITTAAGSKIFGQRIDLCTKVDDVIKPDEVRKEGLKMIDFTIMPHWGSDYFKERFEKGFDQIWTEGLKLLPITNRQYIWIKDGKVEFIQV